MAEKNADGLDPRPMIGVGLMIRNDMGQVLMGLRCGSHGADLWALPGGALEMGEDLIGTARREALEETGLTVGQPELVSVYEELEYLRSNGKHFIDFGFVAPYLGGTPQILEPEKCREWRWFDPGNMPANIYPAARITIEAALTGRIFTSCLHR